LFRRKEGEVRKLPIKSVTKIEYGVHGSRKIYICHNYALLKKSRIALEIFDPKISQRIINKIKSLREHAIKRDIRSSFLG